jgi:hypothetical protein
LAPSLILNFNACNQSTQVVTPAKAVATTSEVNHSRLDGKREWFSLERQSVLEKIQQMETFEDKFLKRVFFRGENRLDIVLKSLLKLVDLCSCETVGDRTILIDCANFRRNVFKNKREMGDRFKKLRKQMGKKFSYVSFAIENDLPLDTMCGNFPLIFRDHRRIVHCLRLSYAFYLTLVMKQLNQFSFPVRFRKGSFKNSQEYLSEIFIHLYSSLKKLGIEDEKRIIKCFKTSLCYHVSQSLQQDELPEGERFNLLPHNFQPFFRSLDPDVKIRFFFSLLQSKELCEEVPESFIQETLEKHNKQLSSPHPGISPIALNDLRVCGRKFGKIVKKFYRPNDGFYPTNKATCHFPRDRGGVKGDLVYHGRLRAGSNPAKDFESDRMEPFVIGFFGQPGQGKSRILPLLVSQLSVLFPGVSREELTYSRTCNVEFWDGYKGQPIVILDDLGQSTTGKDIQEFQTLVSCNPYVLPMADLADKGTYFCSPIIISTSNLMYGMRLDHSYQDTPIIDDASFWRRFHVPIYCEFGSYFKLRESPLWVRPENLLFESHYTKDYLLRRNASKNKEVNTKTFFQSKSDFEISDKSRSLAQQEKWCSEPLDPSKMGKDLINCFKKRTSIHDNISAFWTQRVFEDFDTTEKLLGEEFFREEINPHLPKSLGREDLFKESQTTTLELRFNAFPPEGPLPVRVEPIREALKVRTITAGIGDTFCLKPFQKAMWHALNEFPQFCLTHGTNRLEPSIKRIYEQSSPDDVWISGDYSAATDSFAIEASHALLEGILESIDHEPTKRWAMKEISPHLLIYPKSSGIEPVLQESGQLMGSLLSFPLLCLLNDCTAQSIGLTPDQYLINGDDILMRTKKENYPIWKERVQDYGLSLSLGKNYVHKSYGTVNSQLIFEGSITDSGKQKVLDRRSRVLGECLRDLEFLMKETSNEIVQEIFKTVNRTKLSKTVRSIHVPSSHGGLAGDWGNRDNISLKSKRTEILVYLNDLFNRIEPEKDSLCIPYLSWESAIINNNERMEDAFFKPVTSDEYHEDFLDSKVLPKIKKRLMKNADLRNLFLGQDIKDLPPLTFLKTLQIPFTDEKTRKFIQSKIDRTFFELFFNVNEGFEYSDYRKMLRIKLTDPEIPCSESRKFLLNLMDLDLRPDFLNYVPCTYKAKSFDSNNFKKQLGRSLEPKEFDLPMCKDNLDFSQEVEKTSKMINECLTSMFVNKILSEETGFHEVLEELLSST